MHRGTYFVNMSVLEWKFHLEIIYITIISFNFYGKEDCHIIGDRKLFVLMHLWFEKSQTSAMVILMLQQATFSSPSTDNICILSNLNSHLHVVIMLSFYFNYAIYLIFPQQKVS